jgi:hypothetical protein
VEQDGLEYFASMETVIHRRPQARCANLEAQTPGSSRTIGGFDIFFDRSRSPDRQRSL